MTETFRFTNVSNLAAFGVEWQAGDYGSRYQLVNTRGTMSLLFACKAEGRSEWVSARVVDPSRFMDCVPKTFREFEQIARRYVTD